MIRTRRRLHFKGWKLFTFLTVVGGFAARLLTFALAQASTPILSLVTAVALLLPSTALTTPGLCEAAFDQHELSESQKVSQNSLEELRAQAEVYLYTKAHHSYDTDPFLDLLKSLTNEHQIRVFSETLKRQGPPNLWRSKEALYLLQTPLQERAAFLLLNRKMAPYSLVDYAPFLNSITSDSQVDALKASLTQSTYEQTFEMQTLLLDVRTPLQVSLVNGVLPYSKKSMMNLIDFSLLLKIENPRQVDILVAALKTGRFDIAYEMQAALLQAKSPHQARVFRTILKKQTKSWPTQDVGSLISRVKTEQQSVLAVEIIERDGFDVLWRRQDEVFGVR